MPTIGNWYTFQWEETEVRGKMISILRDGSMRMDVRDPEGVGLVTVQSDITLHPLTDQEVVQMAESSGDMPEPDKPRNLRRGDNVTLQLDDKMSYGTITALHSDGSKRVNIINPPRGEMEFSASTPMTLYDDTIPAVVQESSDVSAEPIEDSVEIPTIEEVIEIPKRTGLSGDTTAKIVLIGLFAAIMYNL